MKKSFCYSVTALVFTMALCVLFSPQARAFVIVGPYSSPTLTSPALKTAQFGAYPNLTTQELLNLSPKTYQQITGQKLTIKQRIVLFMTKKALKKQMQAGLDPDPQKVVEDVKAQFNWGAFALGLFLGLIGLLISFAFKDKNAWRYALMGWGMFILILLLAVTISNANAV